MPSRQLFVALDPALTRFMDQYAARHSRATRSRVVSDALTLMRAREQIELEAAYTASASTDPRMDRALACLANDDLKDAHW